MWTLLLELLSSMRLDGIGLWFDNFSSACRACRHASFTDVEEIVTWLEYQVLELQLQGESKVCMEHAPDDELESIVNQIEIENHDGDPLAQCRWACLAKKVLKDR